MEEINKNAGPLTYKIIVAAKDSSLSECISKLGYSVFSVRTFESLLESCRTLHPDLVIAVATLPGLAGLDATIPIVMIGHDPVLIDQLNVIGIADETNIESMLKIATKNLERSLTAEKEVAYLQEMLHERKLVEQAKGLVMKYCCLDEQQAFRRMRTTASNQNRKLGDLAKAIVDAGEMFQRLENTRDKPT